MKNAVVLLSGGMDSAAVVAMAREQGFAVHALSVRYGQRHTSELDAAAAVAKALGVVAHKTVNVDLRSIGGSALTDDIDVPEAGGEGIPVTYVPARNTIMLSVALGWAEVLGANDIFCGVNAVDYSGYPDCRPEFISAFQTLANLATKAGVEGAGIQVHAPLQFLSKADIVREGVRLGVDFGLTVSCYNADVLLQRRRQRRGLRPLRRLPPARAGLRRRRRGRPDPLRLIAGLRLRRKMG
jgi:7-cyano-7-deazaguanine synthase